jgi:alanine-synthesizing transaminase
MPLPDGEFYRLSKLPPYVFAVINEMKAKLRAAGQDVVDFGMGNPDGASPEPVVQKAIEAIQNPRNHRYSMSRGIPRLRHEIVAHYAREYGVTLDPDKEAIVTMGAKDALAHLLFAVIGPGDHQYGVLMAEGHNYMLPVDNPNEFLNQLEDAYRSISPRPRMVLVSFPHNPTGACVDLDFYRHLIWLANKYGTMVINDFAYADIYFDGYKPPSILEVDGAKDVAVEIYSMTKSFNMAGWRVAFCLGNAKMIHALSRIKSYLDYGIFQPLQIASIIGLRECMAYSAEIRETYRKRRDVLVKGLQEAGWPIESPKASMFVWAKLPEAYEEMGSLEFSKLLMTEALTAVSPGIGFGPLGENHVRFALIENEHRTRQAIRGIKQLLRAGKKVHA